MRKIFTVAGLTAVCVCLGSEVLASGPDGGGTLSHVQGQIKQSIPWCGGAAPTQEQIQRSLRGEPVRVPFNVKAGRQNKGQPNVALLTPDADGRFSLQLPPGDYCVIREAREKMPVASSQYADGACLVRYRETCDAVWQIGAADVERSFTIDNPCFGPCYTGPWPP